MMKNREGSPPVFRPPMPPFDKRGSRGLILPCGNHHSGGETVQRCEDCWHYDYDEEWDEYLCRMEPDEDELFRILTDPNARCPFFQKGDERTLPGRQ